jgi:hypothetical protein
VVYWISGPLGRSTSRTKEMILGLGQMMASGVWGFGYALFLLMASTAVVALTLRSRIATVASFVFIVLVALMAIAFCSTAVDPDVQDWEVRDEAELFRKTGTVWAWGLVVFVPVAIIAAVLAFGAEMSARRERAAVSIMLAIAVPLSCCAGPLALPVIVFAVGWWTRTSPASNEVM